MKNRIAIVISGGRIQDVISDTPENVEVVIVNYDETDTSQLGVMEIVQPEGGVELAQIIYFEVGTTLIDLDEIFPIFPE